MSDAESRHFDRWGHSTAHFGDFTFEFAGNVLRQRGEVVKLPPQPARVLGVLLQSAGSLVTREELRAAVWGDRFADFDQGINYCVRQIRAALDDNADSPRFVETFPRRGYRFAHPVAVHGTTTAGESRVHDATNQAPGRRRRGLILAGACLFAAIVASVWRGVAGANDVSAARLDVPQSADELAARDLPTNDRVQFIRALRLVAERRTASYAAAVTLLDSVVRAHPRFLPAHVRRAESWLWSGHPAVARKALDSLLVVAPDDGRLHTLRGAVALFREWDIARAELHLGRGAALTPSSSMAQHYLAYLRLIRGDSAGARRLITQALVLDPLSPALSGDAGLMAYWLSDYPWARTLCERGMIDSTSIPGAAKCLLWVAGATSDTSAALAAARVLARLEAAPASVHTALSAGGWPAAYLRWSLDRLRTWPDTGRGAALDIVRVHLLLGERSSAVAALDRGWSARSNSLLFATVDPLLRPLSIDTTWHLIDRALRETVRRESP